MALRQGTDPTSWYIDFKDSWNYSTGGPDHNNSLGPGTTYYGYCPAGYDPSTRLTFSSGVTGNWQVDYVMSVSVPEPATMIGLSLAAWAVSIYIRRRATE